MELAIGGKEYKLEYSFEAVLNENCVEKVVELFGSIGAANEAVNNKKGENANETITENALKQMVGFPRTTVSLFYAGLLENNPVDSEDDAKKLLKQYFKENPDEENGTFYGMMTAIIEQMEKDGFFKQIGLIQDEPESQPKTPQDHKKRTTKATAK